MSFEIPKTRSEKILQNILGAKNEIEPIQSRIEAILLAILNDTEIGDPYTAPARCEIEKLLVAIKDGGEYNETPLTRSGRILLCKLRGEDYTGITQSRLEKLFLRWLYELMEITDVPPFTFKSKGNNLIDYDIYGAEDGVGDNEDATVSGNPISISDAVEAPATSLQVSFAPSQASTPWIDSSPTTEPYLSKVIPRGNREYYSLVGGTVAWNQIAPETSSGWGTASVIVSATDNEYTITPANDSTSLKGMHFSASGKKNHVMFCSSLLKISNSDYEVFIGVKQTPSNVMRFDKRTYSTSYELCECMGKVVDDTDMFTIRVGNNTQSTVTANAKNIMFIDLTQMFANNPAIADYAYSLEQSETGAGVQWLKDNGFLTKDYYPHNPCELISVKTSAHKTVGFNQWDEEWEAGSISDLTGEPVSQAYSIRSKNFCNILSNSTYYGKCGVGYVLVIDYYDTNKTFIFAKNITNNIFVTPANAKFFKIRTTNTYGTTYNHDICINISDSQKNGTYEPYSSTTYPLSDTELRGLFKLDANNKLTCEGDLYPPSGSVKRKRGRVDMGTLNWASAHSGDNAFFYTTVADANPSSKSDFISSTQYAFGDISSTNTDNKIICWSAPGSTQLRIRDASYTDTNAFKTSLSGKYFEYELATPTTETLSPYTSPIDVEAGGTEEFIDNRTVPVPVGNETYYAAEYAINGKTSVTVSHGATSTDTPTEYEVQFTSQGTVYGGTVDIVTGELTVTWGYIASYNGETLSGEWMSSKDVYASGTTPSTGAEVAYELATPQTYNLTPEQVTMLLGSNYLETEDGTITLTYKDSNIVLPFSVSCGADVNSYEVPLTDKLYKVSAYADSVSYDDQTVKREIIVERLDGSEEWILSDGVFSTTLTTRARTTAVLCNELTTEQCSIADDLTTLNVTGVPQTSVEEFVAWLQASDVYVQYVRENTLVTPHAVPEVSTFNGTNTFSVDTEVTPSEVTIIYPNRVTTRTLPKTKKIGKSKLMKSK